MLTANTLLVLIFAGGLSLLALVMLFLAIRWDRAVAAMGLIEKLCKYEARLDEKRRVMADLEEEIEKRREAMAVVADLGAEIDGLRRQKEDLLTEWESLREKREEVQAVRGEIEAAMVERMALEADLAPLREEFSSIKDRLERAEDLVRQTAALETAYREMADKVETMRDELQRLEEAEKRVAALAAREMELESNAARLEGRITAQEQELGEARARVAAERESLATVQSEQGRVATDVAAKDGRLRQLAGEIEAQEEILRAREARLAVLNEKIAVAEGRTWDGEDKLRKLTSVPTVITAMLDWEDQERENEADAVTRIQRRLTAQGLAYPDRTLRAFHTAMKVNETTQMAVLAGISGTGKSQLPRQYAAGMGIGFLQVPVQPRWDSPQDLMGFYNYIEGEFRPTDMARALWALDEIHNPDAVSDRMMMILLDEMNLARVEYYFSDFLSRLESRPSADTVDDVNARKDAEIELEIPNMAHPPRIFPGYNLLFAGTMNEDESTQSLSDKVVDRANILRFAAPRKIVVAPETGRVEAPRALSRRTWQGWVRPPAQAARPGDLAKSVETMVELMREFKRPFGHRLGRAITAYVANYPEMEGARPFHDALADQVEMRLLPKLRGIEVELATRQFGALKGFVVDDLGDDKLAEAIDQSINLANDTNGQFVWSGATR